MAEKDLTPQVPGETAEPEPTKAKAAKPEPTKAGLPDASDIDPKKITRATLSKQGWVIPIKPEKA
jgi:hypothetical protein